MKSLESCITDLLVDNGAVDVGFTYVNDGPFNDSYAVSFVIKLSDAVIFEIEDKPTYTYFHHYRTVNSLIDSLSLKVGILLEKKGYSYIPVPASQSINKNGWNFCGRYSHKKIACLAGLGSIGINNLFLHKTFGPCVRLGSVLTDCPFSVKSNDSFFDLCRNCMKCVSACPSGAILGKKWTQNVDRTDIFLPDKCSEYMKNNFKNIGRGAVCGICIKTCYFNNFNIKDLSSCMETKEKISL